MNDRFNIRYFNKNTKKFEYLKIGTVNFNLFTDWTVYEQGQFCTGLKDKNGKLIYEGDIVKDALMNRFTITFNEEYLSYLLTNIKTNEQMVFYPNIKLEVIGNFYENKELLEGK